MDKIPWLRKGECKLYNDVVRIGYMKGVCGMLSRCCVYRREGKSEEWDRKYSSHRINFVRI